MGRHLRHVEGDCFLPTFLPQKNFTETRSGARMHRRAASQVWQAKSRPAIAPVDGSKEGEKGSVLVNGKELAVAKRIASRSEIPREHLDLSNERLSPA